MSDNNQSNKQKSLSTIKVLTGLSTRDVIELIESIDNVKLTSDRLYYYESTGLIVPGVRKSGGRGVKRLYSVRDFIVLRWLVSLNKNGISVQNFRNVVAFLHNVMPEILNNPSQWELVVSGKSVGFKNKVSSQTVDVLVDSGQYLFFT